MEIKDIQNNVSSIIRKGCKDVFHSYMVKDADFDGYYDIPVIPKQNFELNINKLISYDKTFNHIYTNGEVVHFYIDDFKFDGPKGIWNGLNNDVSFKRGFCMSRFKGVEAIICPDFSLYLDMPKSLQIWNIYRNRAVGYYLSKLGFNVIPNIRWTDEESYDFAFDGIYEGQVVAVGTLGCTKNKKDRTLLVNGFIEMLNKIKPSKVIIYGAICLELQTVIDRYSVNIIHFDSSSALYFKGVKYGIKK